VGTDGRNPQAVKNSIYTDGIRTLQSALIQHAPSVQRRLSTIFALAIVTSRVGELTHANRKQEEIEKGHMHSNDVASTASERGSSTGTDPTFQGLRRRQRPTYTSGFVLASLFLLSFSSTSHNNQVHGFTAKLSPPWTGGSGGGGGSNGCSAKRIAGKRRKKRDVKLLIRDEAASVATKEVADEKEEEEDVVISLSASKTGSHSRSNSSFPSEESTLMAAREYASAASSSAASDAAILLSKEVEEHMMRESSSIRNARVSDARVGTPPLPKSSTPMQLRSHATRMPHSSYTPVKTSRSGPTVLSSTTFDSSSNQTPSAELKPHLSSLLRMCRLSNVPGIILFHVIGVYLSITTSPQAAASAALTGISNKALLIRTLMRPSMMSLLLSTLLISVTSMVVNDYYDARSGVDASNLLKRSSSATGAELSSPLASGAIPFAAAKRFLVRLYAMLLVAVTFVPGVPARLCVIGSTLATYWYTQHIKPRTWSKNAAVSAVIAMTPFASGSAAAHLLPTLLGTGGGAIVSQWDVLKSTGRLLLTLFCGFMGREIMMDVRDCEGDRDNGIPTIAVKYGKRYASRVAFTFTAMSAFFVASGPLSQVIAATLSDGGNMAELASTGMRRLILALLGGTLVVNGSLGVCATEGSNDGVTKQAIEMAKIAVLFFLGSFV